MENKQPERNVYFKDLVFVALYRWKWIVCIMVLCALLLGGMELLQGSKDVTLDAISLTPDELVKVEQLQDTLAYRQRAADDYSAYLSTSILMQLDPYNVYTACKYYYVEPLAMTEYHDPSAAIIKWYSLLPGNSAKIAEIAKKLDVPEWAIRELISIRTDAGLQIVVRGRTAEEARLLLDAACVDIEAQYETLRQTLAEHKLTYTVFQNGPIADTNLYDTQNSAYQKLITLQNNTLSTKTELGRLLPTELEPGEAKPLLFAVVGAALGACLVIAIAWIGHIGSSVVYSARTLKDHTGIQLLGCIGSDVKYDFLTRWFRKLESRSTYCKADAVAANIRNRCKDCKSILLLGNYDPASIQPLIELLEQSGIACAAEGNPRETAAVFEKLPCCDAVVLVESCERSRYDDITWEMETIKDYQKNLLGCVLIGG